MSRPARGGAPSRDVTCIALIGLPAAGKTTLAHELRQGGNRRSVISVGDFVRQRMLADANFATLVRARGAAPEGVVEQFVRETLSVREGSALSILDGFPKDVSQAAALDRCEPHWLPILLAIESEEAVRRATDRTVCAACSRPVGSGASSCQDCGSDLSVRWDDERGRVAQRVRRSAHELDALRTYLGERVRVLDAQLSSRTLSLAVESLISADPRLDSSLRSGISI